MRLVPADADVRGLALATLVNTTGNGIFFTLSALYFTRIVGFSVVQVGAGLSIAAGVALLAGIPFGHLADRRGSRGVLVALLLGMTVSSACYLLVAAWWQFVLVATVTAVLDRGASAVRAGMIAGLITRDDRAGTKAYLRSITNVGMTLGTAIAAVALHADTRSAYLTVLYADVATYAVTALLVARLRPVAATPPEEALSMLHALRDLPFVTVTLVSAVLSMQYWILEIAVPLWVVGHTSAPRVLVSLLAVVNTVAVVCFQVAVARRVTTLTTAVRATVVSGFVFVIACAVFGESGRLSVGPAVVVLVVGSAVHVTGEMLQASGQFFFGYELAPDQAQGQYQGVFGLGFSLASFAAPTVMALLPIGLGRPGWWLLGLLLLAAALAHVPAVRWAGRTRHRYA